jgi:pilus assembly protein CpaE
MGIVIGFFSAKGGVGKSILATNLGVAFGVGHGRRTAILDLNPAVGTADILLDLEPERSWADLITVINELTPQHLELAVTEYRPGVDLLACPKAMSWDQEMTREGVGSLLAAFKAEYEVVLLDTYSGTGEVNLAAFTAADLRLIALTPDAPTLRATRRFLESVPDPDKAIGLVINQHTPGAALTPDEIKDHLGQHLLAVLPMDPSGVWANISYGEPCVLRRSSKLGRAVRKLSARMNKSIE